MDDHINKSELAIMVDVTAKNVAQLERVSNSLSSIVDLQKEIQKCLCDNRETCPIRIITHCEKHWLAEKETNDKNYIAIKSNFDGISNYVEEIHKDIARTKLIIAVFCSMIGIWHIVASVLEVIHSK